MKQCDHCYTPNGWWRRRCTACGQRVRDPEHRQIVETQLKQVHRDWDAQQQRESRIMEATPSDGRIYADVSRRDAQRRGEDDFNMLIPAMLPLAVATVAMNMSSGTAEAAPVTAPVIEPGGGSFGGAGASGDFSSPSPSVDP